MEECFGGEQKGNASPETVRRWIGNVNNVLSSSVGRQRFKDFLEECSLDDCVHLVMFWEICHEVAPDETSASSTQKTHTFRFKNIFKSTKDDNIITKAKSILSFAEEKINLNYVYLQNLNKAIRSKSHDAIVNAVLEAKNSSVILLQQSHCRFSEHLLKQQGVSQGN